MAPVTCSISLVRLVRLISHAHDFVGDGCNADCLCFPLFKLLKEEFPMSKDLLKTPSDLTHSTSTEPSGKCHDNGEPGLPGRTMGPNSINEVTYDENSSLAKGEQK